jgi:Acyl-coenzyme A:6-aminopenicillanic acid acyl-transferase
MLKIEVMAKGDAFEMGVAQGEHVGEKIRSAPNVLAQLYGFRALQPAWMPYPLYRRVSESRATRLLEKSLQRDFLDAYARIKGISAGSKTSVRLLHLLHALEPMLSDVHGCSVVPDFAGCSAVAVRGRRSAMHEPVIVRNFDYLPVVQPLYTMRDSRPRFGMRSLDFTIAPFAGAVDGINEKGLCITYDYAYVNDFSGSGTAPISISIAEALQRCATVEDAAELISSYPRWGGGILMLADATGDIASLELSNTRSQLRRPHDGADVLFHTNAFFTEQMKAVEFPESTKYTAKAPPLLRGRRVHESANVRDFRLNELLAGDEPLDLDQLSAIMGDHETGGKAPDTSICKHSDYWNTTATVQLLPKSRRMRVAFDSACRAKYTDFTL